MLDKQTRWWQQQFANIKDKRAITQKSRILLSKTHGTLHSHIFHKHQYSTKNIYSFQKWHRWNSCSSQESLSHWTSLPFLPHHFLSVWLVFLKLCSISNSHGKEDDFPFQVKWRYYQKHTREQEAW